MYGARQRAARPAVAPPATILLAAGSRSVERRLFGAVQAQGRAVLTTTDASAVLPMLRTERIDLLILDVQSDPDAGYELCGAIKARNELGFIPIVILDETDTRWPDDTLDYPPDALLLTPVDPRELHDTIEYLLRLRREFNRLLTGAPANRAREIEVLRADIIRNVSHELVTPLLQVKSVISRLLDPANSVARPASLDSMARAASGRLEEVVENIQQLAQAHAISLAPFIVADALSGALHHVERSWRWQEHMGRIQVHNHATEEIALGDRIATARLLQLLLENALKFSPPEEPVLLLALPLENRHVWFAVEDSGIGIAPEEQERIFEVFYQVDRSPRRRYEGAGTGLALAMLLADGMGSEIAVDSAPGQGSTFSFTLPLIDSA